MNLFKTNIQPTIVCASSEAIIEDAKGKYFLNYNMLELDWFESFFTVSEDGLGMLIMEDDDPDNPLDEAVTAFTGDEDPDSSDSHFDVPRLFFYIDESISDDDRKIVEFIHILLMKSTGRGDIWDLISYEFNNSNIKFYINDTLAKYLTNIEGIDKTDVEPLVLSNYILDNGDVNVQYWDELDGFERDYTNLDYYALKNKLANNEFDIDDFYSTFCGIILEYSLISDDSTINNQIYRQVLNYYNNMKSDETSRGIDLILGGVISEVSPTLASCACSTKSQTTIDSDTTSCSNLYASAMKEYLSKMLSDTDFYYDWMFIPEIDTPNEAMIDTLIRLIESINDKDFDLSFEKHRNGCRRSACRNNISKADIVSSQNHTILDNYLKVLNYVKSNSIDTKKNSIKVYGQEFAELLDKLQF